MKKRLAALPPAFWVALVTFVVYLPTLRNDFVLWDDDEYIYNNPNIRSLSSTFFRWAFTDYSTGNWHPLTWISHALDYAFWGLHPAGHHLTSILLHTLNTFIVVYLVSRVIGTARALGNTRSRRQDAQRTAQPPGDTDRSLTVDYEVRSISIASAVIGVLFGLHPLHVESVAWVAERKDLLYSLFFMLSIISYCAYVTSLESDADEGNAGLFLFHRDYLMAVVFFLLSLSSKAMAVSLPGILLILDWYPFRRVRSLKNLVWPLMEKVPFILLSVSASLGALCTQKEIGAVISTESVPLADRLMMAAKALMLYLWKMALPLRLSPFYSHPRSVSIFSFEYSIPIVLVIGITAACFAMAKRHKIALAVWGYYCVTLLPVLGIVRVGSQSMADRYTYLSSLGPFMLAGLAAAWVWEKAGFMKQGTTLVKRTAVIGSIVLVVVLSLLTVRQIALWNNSVDLWSYVIKEEQGWIPVAYTNRGIVLARSGKLDLALEDFNQLVLMKPSSADSYYNRGLAFWEHGQPDRALSDFAAAIALKPSDAKVYASRGMVFAKQGKLDRAIAEYSAAIALKPGDADYYDNRGVLFKDCGQLDHALDDLNAAIRLNPLLASAYNNRGLTLKRMRQTDQAIRDYTKAIELDPLHADAYNNRGVLYEEGGQFDPALADYDKAISLNPALYSAHNNRGIVLRTMRQFKRAIQDFTTAITLDSKPDIAYINRGMTYQIMGKPDEALEDFTIALSLNPDNVNAYMVRGELYLKTGSRRLAMKDFQKACSLGSKAGCDALQ